MSSSTWSLRMLQKILSSRSTFCFSGSYSSLLLSSNVSNESSTFIASLYVVASSMHSSTQKNGCVPIIRCCWLHVLESVLFPQISSISGNFVGKLTCFHSHYKVPLVVYPFSAIVSCRWAYDNCDKHFRNLIPIFII